MIHLILPLAKTPLVAIKKVIYTNTVAKDLFHNAAKQALLKEKWVITIVYNPIQEVIILWKE